MKEPPELRKIISKNIRKTLDKEAYELFLTDTVLELHSFLTQNEREINKKKQADGIAAARARGVHLGRPAVKLPDNFSILKKQWEQGELSIKDFSAITGIKESTLYRRLREYK